MKYKVIIGLVGTMALYCCSPKVVVTPLKTEQVPYIEQPAARAADTLAVPITK